jgi:hypothetical protein
MCRGKRSRLSLSSALPTETNGPHLYYYQTGDTIYRIKPDIMADIARLTFLAASSRADRVERTQSK